MKAKTIEKSYPYIIAIVFAGIYFCMQQYLTLSITNQQFSALLNMSLAIAGISLGFIGTMIGVFLSILSSEIMKQIYQYRADKAFIRYISEAAISNLILFFLSTFFMLVPVADTIPSIYSTAWFCLFLISFLCSCRIIQLLFKILRVMNVIKREEVIKKNETSQKSMSYSHDQLKDPDFKNNPPRW